MLCKSFMCVSSWIVFISSGYLSVEPSNHLQNLGDHLTGSLKRYVKIQARSTAETRAADLPRYIFPCHKAVLDSALAPHSTVHLNTLSCWKQQRPQSEHISGFTLSMLLLTCGLIAVYCVTHALTLYAREQTFMPLLTSGVNVVRKVKWWRQWRM